MTAELMRMLSGGVGQRIGWALVHFLWQGALVAGVVGLVLQALRRKSPQARYAVACLGVAVMGVLPVATVAMITVRDSPAAEVGAVGGAAREGMISPTPMGGRAGSATFTEEGPLIAPPPQTGEAVLPRGASVESARVGWMEWAREWVAAHLAWVVLVWMAGAAGLSLWHVGGWVMLQRMRWSGKLPGDLRVVEAFGKLLARMKVRRAAGLLESALVKAPLAIGWMKPVVLLPLGMMSGLSAEQVEAILAHELAHVRRWDCLVRMLQAGVETVLFFHPAVWWMSARVTQESEHCCDEIAVAICGDREGYARALAKVAGAWAFAESGLVARMGGGKLLPRLRRILGVSGERRSGRTLLAALAGLALVVAVVAVPLACSMDSRPVTQAADARAIVRAKITFYYDENGNHLAKSKTQDVTDPKELAALAAFFPEMGKGKEAWLAGGWKSGVEIKFSRADGKVLPVAVSENDDWKIWSEGHGDWNVTGDLAAYLKKLRESAAGEAATRGAVERNLPIGDKTFGGLRIESDPADNAKEGLCAIGPYPQAAPRSARNLYDLALKGIAGRGAYAIVGRLPDNYTPLKIMRFTRKGHEFAIEVALSPKKAAGSNYIWGELPRNLPAGRYHVEFSGPIYENGVIPAENANNLGSFELECYFGIGQTPAQDAAWHAQDLAVDQAFEHLASRLKFLEADLPTNKAGDLPKLAVETVRTAAGAPTFHAIELHPVGKLGIDFLVYAYRYEKNPALPGNLLPRNGPVVWDGRSEQRQYALDRTEFGWKFNVTVRGKQPAVVKKVNAIIDAELSGISVAATTPGAADTAKETIARRNAGVARLVGMLRTNLPAAYEVESKAGEFTPRYWTEAGKGTEITVMMPGVPGAAPMKGGNLLVARTWRCWLMEPGYKGEPEKWGPNELVPQKNPAMEWGLWRGGDVVREDGEPEKLDEALSAALAETESAANRAPGNFQTFVSRYRQMASATRWVEQVNQVQHFTPYANGHGDLLCLTSWPEPKERPHGMYIWVMSAGFKGMPDKLEDGDAIRFVMTWNGRPVFVAANDSWQKALEEAKAALAATEAKADVPEALRKRLTTVMPANWQVARTIVGEVSPTNLVGGQGQAIFLERKGTPAEDEKRGLGGGIFIWIMEPGYSGKSQFPRVPGKAPLSQVPDAREVGQWRGRRVFISGWGGADWTSWRKDVEGALKATGAEGTATQPATGPAAAEPTTMPALTATTPSAADEVADYKRLCAVWRKTEPEIGEAKGIVTPEERALLMKELSGHRGGVAPQDFRRMAAITLGNLRAKEAVPQLLERLGDTREDSMVRAEAAGALGRIGDKSAIAPLLDALGDTRDVEDRLWIRVQAAGALRALAPTARDVKTLATPEHFRALLAVIANVPLPKSESEWLNSPSTTANKSYLTAKDIDALCEGLMLVHPPKMLMGDQVRAANVAGKLLSCGFPVYAFDPATFPGLARFCQAYQPAFYSKRTKAMKKGEAATQPATGPAAANSPWRRKLSCGAVVELVGVRKDPSADHAWWRPDGTPLAKTPEGFAAAKAGQLTEPGDDFAIMVTGLPFSNDFSMHTHVDPKPVGNSAWLVWTDIQPPEDTPRGLEETDVWLVSQSIAAGTQHAMVRFGVADGKWETDAAEKINGGTSYETFHKIHGTDLDVSFAQAHVADLPLPAAWHLPPVKTVYVTVAHNLAVERQVRVVAVLNDGKEVVGGTSESSGGLEQITACLRRDFGNAQKDMLALKDIKEIRLQSRPYEWVEFKDVALRAK